MGTSDPSKVSVVRLALAFCLCFAVISVGAAGFLLYNRQARTVKSTEVSLVTVKPTLTAPSAFTPTSTVPTPFVSTQVVPSATPRPISNGKLPESVAWDTLKTLMSSGIPINDPVLIAQKYKGVGAIEPTVPSPAHGHEVGENTKIWMQNNDSKEFRQVSASLRYATPHLYFWVEDAVPYDLNNIQKISDAFENKIYPTDRQFFGNEWSPGIDGEIPLYVLYARNIGQGIAGYYDPSQEIPPAANPYSNAHEMFIISADTEDLTSSYDYGIFAHEFQHMIQYNADRNEEAWMNEGFSELAQLLNQYDTSGFDHLYLSNPDLQLNDWSPDIEKNGPHYGASFLFFTYILGRLGEQVTQAIVANTANGLDSIDAVFTQLNLKNPTGGQLTAADVFADWVVANYVRPNSMPGGLYAYKLYPDAPKANPTELFAACPLNTVARTVHQYAVKYLELFCKGTYTLDFQGAQEVPLLPADPHSGRYAFWSNKGDQSDMTLSREFDLSGVKGPVSIQYSAWYDMEKNVDYTFFSVSEDGKTWKTLKTPSGTDKNPGGGNLGWGYTGISSGWVQENVDLSAYAGKKIQLRFEYLTDAAVNLNGFMVDDISIPALNYQTDFEKDEGGWKGDGFVRVANSLPQTFRVSLIKGGSTTSVEPLVLDPTQHGTVKITIGANENITLVVSGTTRFTTQTASFQFSVR